MKSKLLALICILCFGCQKKDPKQTETHEEIDLRQQLTDKARANATRNMKKKYGLRPSATGGSGDDKIEYLITWYRYYGKSDLSLARTLYINAVQELVDQVNALEGLKPYLKETPFIPQRADVTIFFLKPDGRNVEPGEICNVDLSKERVTYYTKDKNNKEIIILQESYSEALEAIQKQRQVPESLKAPKT